MLEKWLKHEFSNGETIGDDFKQFSKDFRKCIKDQLSNSNVTIAVYSREHYFASGFVYCEDTAKYAYFSISDVRFWSSDWHENILIRTAKSDKDYTGGRNNYTTLADFAKNIVKLVDGTIKE